MKKNQKGKISQMTKLLENQKIRNIKEKKMTCYPKKKETILRRAEERMTYAPKKTLTRYY